MKRTFSPQFSKSFRSTATRKPGASRFSAIEPYYAHEKGWLLTTIRILVCSEPPGICMYLCKHCKPWLGRFHVSWYKCWLPTSKPVHFFQRLRNFGRDPSKIGHVSRLGSRTKVTWSTPKSASWQPWVQVTSGGCGHTKHFNEFFAELVR